MKFGTDRYGFIKSFLTRGFLRSIFRPLLYTKSDYFHSTFIETLLCFHIFSDSFLKPKNRAAFYYWLIIVPKSIFEQLFIENERGEVLINMIKKASKNKGKECALITQTFIIFYLQEYILKDKEFKETMGFTVEEINKVLKAIWGDKNEMMFSYDYYQNKKQEVELLDWPIVYLSNICYVTLSSDKLILQETMQSINNDLIWRTMYIKLMSELLVSAKECSPR